MAEALTWLEWLGIAVALAATTYVAYGVARLAHFRSQFSRLQLDFAELWERFTALEDRFTRFQRREGMRQARSEKTTADDLKREAEAIVAQAGGHSGASGQPPGGRVSKADLYRKAGRH
jgi:hypothetical protein